MATTGLRLTFRDDPPPADEFVTRSWNGFFVECAQLHGPRAFEYSWQGDANYLALHDIALSDGEIAIESELRANRADLRNRLTFVPHGMRVSGWSQLARGDQGYTAVFFDPNLAEAELDRPLLRVASRPLLYFENAQLSQTLRRFNRLVSIPHEHDALTAETLGLLAVLQLYPSLGLSIKPASGQLSPAQQRRIREFLQANLHSSVALSDLAAVAGLSRFHFARSFSRTYGRSPHQHVLMHKIGLVATLLATSNIPLAEIAIRAGFTTPARLSTAFRRMVGKSPRSFRQASR